MAEKEHTFQALLALERVCLATAGGFMLEDVNLCISQQGVTAIMGANGAGKSMLLKTIHGLTTVTSGRIKWRGEILPQNIQGERRRQMRMQQAMLFQRPTLLRRSTLENVEFAMASRNIFDRGRALRLLRDVGLQARQNQAARSLSGGEQQRLALARALSLNPQVLLMDEPSASLDPVSAQMIETIILQQSARKIKVLLVTHNRAEARRLADDVVFIHHGRVLEHSPAEQFFEQPECIQGRQYLAGEIVV